MAMKPLFGALGGDVIMGIIIMVGGLILQLLQKKAGAPDFEPDEAPEPKPVPRRRKQEAAPPKPKAKVIEKPRGIVQRPAAPPPQRARALSAARRHAVAPLLVSPAMMRDNLHVRRSLAMKVILDRPRCESF